MSNVEQQVQKEIVRMINAHLLPETSMNIFREKLATYIAELIDNDFAKLINILYRLDISEQKLKTLLASSAEENADLLIADLIIERQLQKIKFRQQFQQQSKDIPDEEKW